MFLNNRTKTRIEVLSIYRTSKLFYAQFLSTFYLTKKRSDELQPQLGKEGKSRALGGGCKRLILWLSLWPRPWMTQRSTFSAQPFSHDAAPTYSYVSDCSFKARNQVETGRARQQDHTSPWIVRMPCCQAKSYIQNTFPSIE